jgi:hypothetical protein
MFVTGSCNDAVINGAEASPRHFAGARRILVSKGA